MITWRSRVSKWFENIFKISDKCLLLCVLRSPIRIRGQNGRIISWKNEHIWLKAPLLKANFQGKFNCMLTALLIFWQLTTSTSLPTSKHVLYVCLASSKHAVKMDASAVEKRKNLAENNPFWGLIYKLNVNCIPVALFDHLKVQEKTSLSQFLFCGIRMPSFIQRQGQNRCIISWKKRSYLAEINPFWNLIDRECKLFSNSFVDLFTI